MDSTFHSPYTPAGSLNPLLDTPARPTPIAHSTPNPDDDDSHMRNATPAGAGLEGFFGQFNQGHSMEIRPSGSDFRTGSPPSRGPRVPFIPSGGPRNLTRQFTVASQLAELDESHHAYGLKFLDTLGDPDNLIAILVHALDLHQRLDQKLDILLVLVDNLQTHKNKLEERTIDKTELRAFLTTVCPQVICAGYIGAYLAVEDDTGDQIRNSFTAEIWRLLMAKSPSWRDSTLGKSYFPPVLTAKTRKNQTEDPVRKIVLEKTKWSRSELQTEVLDKIPTPERPTVPDLPVPHQDLMIYSVRKCLYVETDGSTMSRRDVLRLTDHATRFRFVFLRWVLCDYHHNPGKYKKSLSQWALADSKLAALDAKTARFRYAFAIIVVADDIEVFDGKRTWTEASAYMRSKARRWELPSDERVENTMAELSHRFKDNPIREEYYYQNPLLSAASLRAATPAELPPAPEIPI